MPRSLGSQWPCDDYGTDTSCQSEEPQETEFPAGNEPLRPGDSGAWPGANTLQRAKLFPG